VAGFAAASTAAVPLGLRVMPGTELSVKAPWGEMHLLAYGFDPADQPLLDFLRRATELRRERGRAIVAAVAKLGVPLTFDDVLAEATGAPIGRPHVARALITRRVVTSIDEAFDRFLGRGRPAYVPKTLPTTAGAAEIVHAAGGICSAAHLKDRATREGLLALKRDGVDAIEVRHPSHSPAARPELERLVRSLGLVPTGGSDWHGESAAGPSHGTIGAERIPRDWVAAIDAAVAVVRR
jgi:predicted metal-dependent phosphoesterase TrpH